MPPVAGEAPARRLEDFTFDAATWTLTAHEARPGHELQFASMVENGVSLARALFAFNSVNVEGWALYAEAETQPYLPARRPADRAPVPAAPGRPGVSRSGPAAGHDHRSTKRGACSSRKS